MRLKKVVDDEGRERVVRANRYNFRPHCGTRERLRRLRQIVDGRIKVDDATRLEATDLLLQITEHALELERGKQTGQTA